jgi:hypothetical protein
MANNPCSPPTAEGTDRLDEAVRGTPRAVLIGTGIVAVLAGYSLLGLYTRYDFSPE